MCLLCTRGVKTVIQSYLSADLNKTGLSRDLGGFQLCTVSGKINYHEDFEFRVLLTFYLSDRVDRNVMERGCNFFTDACLNLLVWTTWTVPGRQLHNDFPFEDLRFIFVSVTLMNKLSLWQHQHSAHFSLAGSNKE